MSIRQKIQIATMLTIFLTLVVLAAQAQGPVATDTPADVTPTPTPTGEPPTFWLLTDQVSWIVAVFLAIMGFVVGRLFGSAIDQWAKEFWQRAKWWKSDFDDRYMKHLIEEHRGLNIKGLRTRAPFAIDLERVYVSLRTRLPEMVIEVPEEQQLPLGIGEAMERHKRLVILGGAGTGKTTLQAYLTLTYARKLSRGRLGLEENLLPIFIPLRQLRKVLTKPGDEEKKLDTLPTYLTAYYEELGLQPPPDFFEKEMRSGRCLVLLDGLDEVTDEAERSLMSEWVDNQVAIYPDNRYVVTSRPPGYEKAPLTNGFTTLYLCDFTERDISQFANNWCLAIETVAQGEENETARRRADKAAKDLVQAINKNEAIHRLAINPLMLSIIALLHRYRAHLPEHRVDLYGECVEVLLSYWDRAKGLVKRLSPAQKRAVLQSLALTMHKNEVYQLPRGEVERLVAGYLPPVGGGQATLAAVALFLDEVQERSGLLVEREMGTYAFSSRVFQEYLAACEIARSEDEAERAFLVDKATSEWWWEVLLLYARMRDPSPMVRALLARDREERETGKSDRTHLLLAGECLTEAVKIQSDVRHDVERELESLFTAQLEPRAFLRAGRVLARLKGDDALDYFLWLMDKGQEQVRTAAALALGQMGHEADLVLLERIVRELLSRVDDPQRAVAASMALSEIGWAPLMDALPEEVRDEVLQKGILALLRDQDPKLRAAAARTMVRGYGSWPQEIQALLDDVLWHDESFEVRKRLYDSINQHASELPKDIVLRSARLIPGHVTARILGGGILFGQTTPIRIRIENQSPQPRRNVTFELVETAECEFPSGRARVIPRIDPGGWVDLEFLANAREVRPSISVSYKVDGVLGIYPLHLMSTQGNPYSYGGVTRGESLIFYGRESEVNDILSSVVQPEEKTDIFLYGERRTGKTSMLLHLEELIQLPYVPVYFTPQDLPSKYTSRDFLLLLVKRARDALVEHTRLSLEAPSDQGKVLSDALEDLLKQISEKGYDFRLVLLIDEADEMIELAQREATSAGPDYALAKNIRATLQKLPGVRAVIAGTSKFDSDIRQISSPLFNQLKKVTLKPLSVDATRSLIREPANKFGRQYETAAENRIVDLSGGHPYYCLVVCHHAYNEAAHEGRNTISVEDIAAAEKAVLDGLESFRDAFWDRMTLEEREFVCAVAARAKTLPDIPRKSIRKLEKDWCLIKSSTRDAAQFEFYAELFAAWIKRLCLHR